MYSNFCKGCNNSVHISKEEVEKIFGKDVRIKGENLVSWDEYNRRVQICKNCNAFIYGTTCKYCGCLVDIKAKFVSSSCPYPYKAKW